MRRIRVKAENGERYAAILRAAGYHARWLGSFTASTTAFCGCADPGCCAQHESSYRPAEWGSIETDASGRKAHALFAKESS